MMSELRENHLAGKPISDCKSCWNREKRNVRSRRQVFENDLSEELRENCDTDSLSPSLNEIVHFDISFGNVCNLNCRFCGPDKSSKWQKLLTRLPSDELFSIYRKIAEDVEPIDTSKLINDVLQLKALEILEMKGGEPLIHPAHTLLLKNLIAAGRSQQLRLIYSSNLTQISDDVLELWKHFREVDIAVSIDGPEKVQKYIRGNKASLETVIIPNIEKLKKASHIRFSSHTTICAYNFYFLEELFEILHQHEIVRNSVGLVSFPSFLSPFVLDPNRAIPYLEKLKESRFEVLRQFALTVNKAEFEQRSQKQRQVRLFHFTQTLDQYLGSEFGPPLDFQ